MALPDDCEQGDYVLRMDGNMWMATAPCYGDLQDSPMGFGPTQEEAIADLAEQPQFRDYLSRGGDMPPGLEHFTVLDAEGGSSFVPPRQSVSGASPSASAR